MSGILHFARGRPDSGAWSSRRSPSTALGAARTGLPVGPAGRVGRVNGFAQPLRPGFGDALAVAFGIGFVVAVAAATADTQASSERDGRPARVRPPVFPENMRDPSIDVDRMAERSARQRLIEGFAAPRLPAFSRSSSMDSVRAPVRQPSPDCCISSSLAFWKHCCIGSGPSRFSSDTRGRCS